MSTRSGSVELRPISRWHDHFRNAVIICVALVFTVLIFTMLPVTFMDWMDSFRPTAANLETPYGPGIFNPPWLFVILHPLTWFDPRVGASLLIVISLVIISIYVKAPKKVLLVACSAPLIALVTLGQIDGLIILGLMLPAEIGLVWLMMKPQGVFLTALRRLSPRSIIIAGSILVLSVLVWGFWWQDLLLFRSLTDTGHNVSLFPYTMLLGLPLIYLGLKRNSDALLCLASLSFSPYFMITSTLPAVAAIVRESEDRRVWFITITGSWVFFFLTKFVL